MESGTKKAGSGTEKVKNNKIVKLNAESKEEKKNRGRPKKQIGDGLQPKIDGNFKPTFRLARSPVGGGKVPVNRRMDKEELEDKGKNGSDGKDESENQEKEIVITTEKGSSQQTSTPEIEKPQGAAKFFEEELQKLKGAGEEIIREKQEWFLSLVERIEESARKIEEAEKSIVKIKEKIVVMISELRQLRIDKNGIY